MRRIFHLPAFLLGFASIVSCGGENIDSHEQKPSGDPDPLKVYYVETDRTWQSSDSVSVFSGTGRGGGAVFVPEEMGGPSPVKLKQLVGDPLQPPFLALFPYDAGYSCDGESVCLVMPSVRAACEAAPDGPLFAYSDDGNLAFCSVLGGIKLSLVRDDVVSVTVRSGGGESLAGQARISQGDDEFPVLEFTASLSDSISFRCPGCFVAGKEYLLPLPFGVYEGMELVFRTAGESAVRSLGGQVRIARPKSLSLENADYGLEYRSNLPEKEPEEPEYIVPEHEPVPVSVPECPDGYRPLDLSSCEIRTNNPMQYVTWNFCPDGDWKEPNLPITSKQKEYRFGMYDRVENMWDGDAATCFHTNFDVYETGSSWRTREGTLVRNNEIVIKLTEPVAGKICLWMVNPVNGFFMGYTVVGDHQHAFVELEFSSNGYSWYRSSSGTDGYIPIPGSDYGTATFWQDVHCPSLTTWQYIRIAPHCGETSFGTFSREAGCFGLAELRVFTR